MRRPSGLPVLLALLISLCCASAALAAGKTQEGWGPQGSYVGRYHVDVLEAGDTGVRGGELTMFIQEEFPGSETPAGILKLRTRTNNDVVYLKELKHQGRARTAIVKGGSFLGPTIGRFIGKMRRPGKIVANVSTHSLGTVELLFTRYSRKPTP
ncbi:MAG: hypothetical protein JST59_25145 [Actinobacteria bacterium]|nr:hypothetical protein [Actinomycetota bacterium]